MTTVKQLLAIAAISIAALAPASAQVSGGFAFRMPIFNSNSEQVFNGIPSGRMTSIYDLTGRYISRVHAKAVIDGQVISLLDLHIGCTDPVNAERAFVTPNIADSTRCEILLTSIPYTIVRNATPEKYRNDANAPIMVCVRPPSQPNTSCQWVALFVQPLYTR